MVCVGTSNSLLKIVLETLEHSGMYECLGSVHNIFLINNSWKSNQSKTLKQKNHLPLFREEIVCIKEHCTT